MLLEEVSALVEEANANGNVSDLGKPSSPGIGRTGVMGLITKGYKRLIFRKKNGVIMAGEDFREIGRKKLNRLKLACKSGDKKACEYLDRLDVRYER